MAIEGSNGRRDSNSLPGIKGIQKKAPTESSALQIFDRKTPPSSRVKSKISNSLHSDKCDKGNVPVLNSAVQNPSESSPQDVCYDPSPVQAISTTRQSRQPRSMVRAKSWDTQIENAFRYQIAGYRDEEECLPAPELLPEPGFVRCLVAKKTGFFMYFRQSRECSDKHLNKIKIYSY